MKAFFTIVFTMHVAIAAAATTITEEGKKRTIRGRQLLLDPKTLEQKPAKDNNRKLALKGFYGMDIFHENSVLPLDFTSLKELRYITFGSSHTWGSGVEKEPGHSRYDAFPYLLSPDVNNMAIRAHDLGYPALCTESMLGDEVYDVAVIQEVRIEPWNPNKPSHILGRRLRERFPDIIIVYINHIYPTGITWQNGRGVKTSLRDWAKEHAAGLTKANPFFLQKMKEYAEMEEGKWVQDYLTGTFTQENEKMMQDQLGENTFFVDLYSDSSDDGLRYMELFGNFTCEDYHHPCHIGHRSYANAVQQIVQKVVNTASAKTTTTQLRATQSVVPWMPHDKCESWFDSNGLDTMDTNVPSQGFQFNCFEPKVKCSLELTGYNNSNDGSITIYNPNDTEQHLAVTFMATNAGHPSIRYPKVQVKTIDSAGNILIEKIADPTSIRERYGHDVHIAKLLTLGTVPSGEIKIQFTYIDNSEETTSPFRLVSYLITDQKAAYRGVSAENSS